MSCSDESDTHFWKFRPDFVDSNLKVSQYSLFDEHNLNLVLVQNTFWKKKKFQSYSEGNTMGGLPCLLSSVDTG